MDLCMTGIDFVHAPLEKRERVSLVRGQVQALMPCIAAQKGVQGCVLLATCNRTELYLHGAEDAKLDPLAVLAEAAGFDAAEYRGCSITRTGEDAVHHLMQVAAGLESQIFGDDQIVSQVKGAVALAREAKTVDAVLDTLFRRAVTAGKRVRTETRLTGVPASAAEVGARRAKDFFGSLEGKRAVVIGNGEMGRLAASTLRAQGGTRSHCDPAQLPPRRDRRARRVRYLADDTRCEVLDGADLAVSATTSPHFTLTAEQVAAMQSPPRLLLDLAMPRDIEQAVGEDSRVTLLNLDDLGDLGDHNAEAREVAMRILGEEEQAFYEWYGYRQALPLIAAVKDEALTRLHYDHAYSGLHEDGDLDGLAELAVNKTVDLLLGGMKELVDAEHLAACLAHMRKGSGR